MAFTLRDFGDLLRILDRHPEWLEALRQRLLTEELLATPKALRTLSRRWGRVEKALGALVEAQRRTEQALAALTEAQQRTERALAELAEAQRRSDAAFEAFRAEADRRLAALQEEVAAARAEADRRFAELAEAQRRSEERGDRLEQALAALAEAQRRSDAAFEAFRAEADRRFTELREEIAATRAEADRRLAALQEEVAAARAEADRRFAELAEAQRRSEERGDRLEQALAALAEAQRRTDQRVSDLDGLVRGMIHEDRYRTRPHRYRRLVAAPAVLSPEEREALLREAEETGRLAPEEAEALGEADVIVRGQRREGEGEVYVVVEVSAVIATEDVARAAARAGLLRKARPQAEVMAAVAGPEIHPLARAAARDQGVWWLRGSHPFAPHEIPT